MGRVAIGILCDAGVPVERAGWVAFSVLYYVPGHVIEEQAGEAGAWTVVPPPDPDEADLRTFTAVAAVYDADPAERFDYGLALLLDGLRHRLSTVEDR